MVPARVVVQKSELCPHPAVVVVIIVVAVVEDDRPRDAFRLRCRPAPGTRRRGTVARPRVVVALSG